VITCLLFGPEGHLEDGDKLIRGYGGMMIGKGKPMCFSTSLSTIKRTLTPVISITDPPHTTVLKIRRLNEVKICKLCCVHNLKETPRFTCFAL
jgi:hypothetical protein